MGTTIICDMEKFYEAFNFLKKHPIFRHHFQACLDVMVVIDAPEPQDEPRTRVWFECGPYNSVMIGHDYDLDVYADSYEEAIILLAEKVKDKYGIPSEEEIENTPWDDDLLPNAILKKPWSKELMADAISIFGPFDENDEDENDADKEDDDI